MKAVMHVGRSELTLLGYDPQTGKEVKTSVSYV